MVGGAVVDGMGFGCGETTYKVMLSSTWSSYKSSEEKRMQDKLHLILARRLRSDCRIT